MYQLRKLLKNPYLYVAVLTYFGVWLCWDLIKLPFSNPLGIISFIPTINYNPSSNIVRFLAAIFAPPLACLGLWLLLNSPKIRHGFTQLRQRRITTILIISAGLILSICMGIVQASTNPANNPVGTYGGPYAHAQLDTFHEGETLGPAVSYQDPNLKPYRDFVIVHGVFQDPLRSVIAFNLFGQSIGATRAFATILTITTFILYFVLLLVLFRGNAVKSVLGLLFLSFLTLPAATIPVIGPYIYGVQLPFRDIATILFLIAAIVGLRSRTSTSPRALIIASGIIGFIAIAGFANSIDRAFYIAALSAGWLLMMALLLPVRRLLRNVILPYVVGSVIGIGILGIALKWAFADFFEYLATISHSKEFLDGIVFARPDLATNIVLLSVAAILTIFGATVISALKNKKNEPHNGLGARAVYLKRRLGTIVEDHYIAILLGLTAIVFLRSAIGRALPDHFIYSVQWLYLLLAYLLIRYLFIHFKNSRLVMSYLVLLLLGFMTTYYAGQVKRIDIGQNAFPINVSDQSFMRTDHIETTKFLKSNLKPDERFVTLTSEAAWYYYVDQPSPIKYPVIWYAFMPKERLLLAEQLRAGTSIRYVITNNNWTSNFDYIANETRFPELYKVLYENYQPLKGIGQQTIWIRQ